MSRKERAAQKRVAKTDDSIVLRIDRQTARRLVDEWRMFDDEVDAVEAVVERGLSDLDAMRDRLDADDQPERPWGRSK